MTTENVEFDDTTTTETDDTSSTTSKPRNIKELLTLTTYQGMTDDEIQLIIDYRVEQAHTDEVVKAQIAIEVTTMNETAEIRSQQASESNDILKQLLSKSLDLTTIKDDDAQEG